MIALGIAVAALISWLFLLVARGGFWLSSVPQEPPALTGAWPSVVAVIPARDEAETIGRTVASLLTQRYDGAFQVILVDDSSSDGTAQVARDTAAGLGPLADRLTIVQGTDLPSGWTGKLWAVENGLRAADRLAPDATYIWLTDADIGHGPTTLESLVRRAEAGRLDLVSLMVTLNCQSFAERLLIPAFVFFFQMLYPFVWVNRPSARTAAAAGGCMLVRRSALMAIGGIGAIRGALIDDCALGAALKRQGPIWLGLGVGSFSLRPYPTIDSVWRMIARSAYTQLKYSPWLLLGTMVFMALAYVAPPLLSLLGEGSARWVGLTAWTVMTVAFLPSVLLYRRLTGLSLLWVLALPVTAVIYLMATVDSARRHWRGRGGEWKGRYQAATTPGDS